MAYSDDTKGKLYATLGQTAASEVISHAEGADALTDFGVTASAAELNILDGVTATAEEINFRDRSVWFGFDEDFLSFSNGDLFTDTSADTGASCASQDAAGGKVLLTTGATLNNEAYLHTTKEIFKFAEGKTIIAEWDFQYTEAATNKANVIMGLVDAVGANTLVDDGVGPKSSYSGAVFFKVADATVWNTEVSISNTQGTDATAVTAGGATAQVFRIEVSTTSATSATALFYIDGTLVNTEVFTYTGATEMMFVVGMKAGGNGTSETGLIDRARVYQKR